MKLKTFSFRGTDIPMITLEWFKEKEPLMVVENPTEAMYRLYWLSEGTLHYQLTGKPLPIINGIIGCPKEKNLAKEFLNYAYTIK